MNPNPVFVVSNDASAISRLVDEGEYCPVECSVGGESIVDDMELDHHGQYSHLPGVAIAAYGQYYGQRADRPFFVTCAPVDADACFATAALLGLLPHLSHGDGESNDLTALAKTINAIDIDPIGINPLDMPHGELVMAWNVIMSGNNRSDSAYAAGTHLWAQLTTAQSFRLKPLLAGIGEAENRRRLKASHDLSNCSPVRYGNPPVLCLDHTTAWGFDVWYDRRPGSGSPKDLAGWRSPVVLALGKQSQEITIGCPNVAVAEILFGKGGLKNVFTQLGPEGWGGREAVGGSPRGTPMTTQQLHDAGEQVGLIVARSMASA